MKLKHRVWWNLRGRWYSKICTGLQAYKLYCTQRRTPANITPSREGFKLENVVHDSFGKTVIRMLIVNHGNLLEYETDLVNVELPVLIGLETMKKHQWYVNEVTDEFCLQTNPNLKVKLKLKHGTSILNGPII